jgi:lysophospholipase L1-like esterase
LSYPLECLKVPLEKVKLAALHLQDLRLLATILVNTPGLQQSVEERSMKSTVRRYCYLLLLAASLTATADAQSKAPVGKLDLQDGDCLVFLGDSITHQRLYTQYVEDFFYTRYPNKRIQFHNAGVGGAKAWDALERFDRDVAAYKPKYVTVLLGMNDGRYQSYDETIWQTYHDDMSKVVAKIVEINAVPVLMTPTMYDSRAALARKRQPAPNYNSVLSYYGTWLREVAVNEGYGFVDMWGPLNQLTLGQRKNDPDFTMIKDAVHPDPPGQLVMAYSIIDDMGLRAGISNIRVTLGAGTDVQVVGPGGEVTDEQTTANGVSFVWAAESLPWAIPPEAQLGAKLLHLGHRASREGLEVHGLAPGKYELLIDDQVVGAYTHIQLARHIELQGNTHTPQYQQALKVVELNRARNQGAVGKLRGEWGQFQRYARTRQQAKGDPTNKNVAAALADLEKKIEGMEERVLQAEAAAKAMEDQIYAINKPVPRKYEIRAMTE